MNHEAFANMFEVSMSGDKDALQHMQEIFPESYKLFWRWQKMRCNSSNVVLFILGGGRIGIYTAKSWVECRSKFA